MRTTRLAATTLTAAASLALIAPLATANATTTATSTTTTTSPAATDTATGGGNDRGFEVFSRSFVEDAATHTVSLPRYAGTSHGQPVTYVVTDASTKEAARRVRPRGGDR